MRFMRGGDVSRGQRRGWAAVRTGPVDAFAEGEDDRGGIGRFPALGQVALHGGAVRVDAVAGRQHDELAVEQRQPCC